MLYDGHSCMYGGIYILKNSHVTDEFSSNVSEALSLRAPSNSINNEEIVLGTHFAIIIIHYKEYSMSTITFKAIIEQLLPPALPVNLSATDNKSINVTILDFISSKEYKLYLHSIIPDLRNLQFIFIIFQREQNIKTNLTFNPGNNNLCIYWTVFYPLHMSNIRGVDYEVEVLNGAFTRYSIIYLISINTSSCSPFIIPVWSLLITFYPVDESQLKGINTISNELLSDLVWWKMYELQVHYTAPFWYMIHLIKPADIPPYAIWRVWMDVCHAVSLVALEVPTDIHLSTSVYKWNHYNTTYNVYITFDVVINILFTVDNIISREICQFLFVTWFRRCFVYDDRSIQYVAGRTPEQNFFTSQCEVSPDFYRILIHRKNRRQKELQAFTPVCVLPPIQFCRSCRVVNVLPYISVKVVVIVTMFQFTGKMLVLYLILREQFIPEIHEINPMQNLRLLQYTVEPALKTTCFKSLLPGSPNPSFII